MKKTGESTNEERHGYLNNFSIGFYSQQFTRL